MWTLEEFEAAWEWLAGLGLVDDMGGAEYRRVLCVWLAAGRPVVRLSWIYRKANLLIV